MTRATATIGEAEGHDAGPDGRRALRRAAILEAAFALLIERGYDGTSMLAIAERARASKESLYAWFGDKKGLFAALILHQAATMNQVLTSALADRDAEPALVLERFGVDFLRLLLGPRAVAINRAAVSDAATTGEFGRLLVAKGRKTTGGLVIRYLELQRAAGRLAYTDVERTFEVLLGLLLRDWQIRLLVGEMAPPSEEAIRARAGEAVALFLELFGTASAP